MRIVTLHPAESSNQALVLLSKEKKFESSIKLQILEFTLLFSILVSKFVKLYQFIQKSS